MSDNSRFPNAPFLRTVSQFCEEFDEFSEGGMRYLIFNEEQNGLAEAEAFGATNPQLQGLQEAVSITHTQSSVKPY